MAGGSANFTSIRVGGPVYVRFSSSREVYEIRATGSGKLSCGTVRVSSGRC